MKDWDDYRLILALARTGTLRMAAHALGMTHTTVSRRLSIIEDARGALFERQPGGYRPTPLGDALIDVAGRMESLTQAGARYEQAVEQDLVGVVTLSLPEPVAQYLLLEDLFKLAEAFPKIELRVNTSVRFVDLDRLEADVVVRGTQHPPEHLVGRRLYPTHITYYGNRDYLASTPPDQLRWIAPSSAGMRPDWLEMSPYPNAPVALLSDDIVARHHALVRGLGLARGACFMADPEPDLIRLTNEAPIPQQDFWVLTHPDLRHTPRVRAVMDFMVRAMKEKEDLVRGHKPQRK
ncbi:LysR family transcriptional regulator [Hyphomonas sp. FCG-A18]|jgi:DNA-binding transcriptional LysR family regulator|uniref:LysR family transcriptional regulator n=1 Tax=Hyphomonas sp. FCG-A18 TaxID=3080019 RepID=UPI002B2BEA6F|nr:LysR family transcriptional regulator [Hyphomonas sp. FCG-A18]